MNKKVWFIGYHSRFWVPVSIEGWAVTASFFLTLWGALLVMGQRPEEQVSLAGVLLFFVVYAPLAVGFYWLTREHVDKRY